MLVAGWMTVLNAPCGLFSPHAAILLAPSNAWARRIYLPQGRMLELGSHGATGPVFGGSACRYLRRAGTGPGLQRLSFPLKRELIGQEASTG